MYYIKYTTFPNKIDTKQFKINMKICEEEFEVKIISAENDDKKKKIEEVSLRGDECKIWESGWVWRKQWQGWWNCVDKRIDGDRVFPWSVIHKEIVYDLVVGDAFLSIITSWGL